MQNNMGADQYLHNLRMEDKYTKPLSDYEIARHFPNYRDIASRHIAVLTAELSYWRDIIARDPLAVYFMAIHPDVKRVNSLRRYMELTAPVNGSQDITSETINRARQRPIQAVFDLIQPRVSANRITCCCPLPGHQDDSPSFVIYRDTNKFYCYGCHSGGDVIDLISAIRGVSFIDAIKILSKSS